MPTGYQWDFSIIFDYADVLLRGLLKTLSLTFQSVLVGSLCGILVAWLKGSRKGMVRLVANGFTDAFRAVPVLVMMIWLFYSFPSLSVALGARPIRIGPELAAVVALSLYLAAQLADILRAGIDSIPKGQFEVARTLGLQRSQIVLHIEAPQVLRLVLPAVLGQYASTLLLSSLASVIAVEELLHQAQNVIASRYHSLEIYTVVALLYLAVAWPITVLAKRLSRVKLRLAEQRQQTEGRPMEVEIPKQESHTFLQVEGMTLLGDTHEKILQKIGFELPPRSVLGLFGPSGSGKTSVLRALAGLSNPSEGTIRWQNTDVDNRCPRLGYVPQDLSLWPHLSALENVALALRVVARKSKVEAQETADIWLDRLGLASRRSAKPKTLSGGEAQRVAIARALAINPEVLLLDEITSALDPELVTEVTEVLGAIAHSGRTMIIVSHHLSAIYPLSTHAIFLHRGRQMDFGPKELVFSGRNAEVATFLSRHALWGATRVGLRPLDSVDNLLVNLQLDQQTSDGPLKGQFGALTERRGEEQHYNAELSESALAVKPRLFLTGWPVFVLIKNRQLNAVERMLNDAANGINRLLHDGWILEPGIAGATQYPDMPLARVWSFRHTVRAAQILMAIAPESQMPTMTLRRMLDSDIAMQTAAGGWKKSSDGSTKEDLWASTYATAFLHSFARTPMARTLTPDQRTKLDGALARSWNWLESCWSEAADHWAYGRVPTAENAPYVFCELALVSQDRWPEFFTDVLKTFDSYLTDFNTPTEAYFTQAANPGRFSATCRLAYSYFLGIDRHPGCRAKMYALMNYALRLAKPVSGCKPNCVDMAMMLDMLLTVDGSWPEQSMARIFGNSEAAP